MTQAHDRTAARQAAHVLLDALVATNGNEQSTEDFNGPAITTALRRLGEVEAVKITAHPETHFSVNVGPLVYGALSLMHVLVRALADSKDVDHVDVISALREVVTDWERGTT